MPHGGGSLPSSFPVTRKTTCALLLAVDGCYLLPLLPVALVRGRLRYSFSREERAPPCLEGCWRCGTCGASSFYLDLRHLSPCAAHFGRADACAAPALLEAGDVVSYLPPCRGRGGQALRLHDKPSVHCRPTTAPLVLYFHGACTNFSSSRLPCLAFSWASACHAWLYSLPLSAGYFCFMTRCLAFCVSASVRTCSWFLLLGHSSPPAALRLDGTSLPLSGTASSLPRTIL